MIVLQNAKLNEDYKEKRLIILQTLLNKNSIVFFKLLGKLLLRKILVKLIGLASIIRIGRGEGGCFEGLKGV